MRAYREQHLYLGQSHTLWTKLLIHPGTKSQQDSLHLLERMFRLLFSLWQSLFFHILRVDLISAS